MNAPERQPLGVSRLLGWALVTLVGCTMQDVIVAEVDAGPPVPIGKPCVSADDCTAAGYCKRNACDDPMGACQKTPLPGECSDQAEFPAPCGCDDGLHYWNTCLRQSHRQSANGAQANGACGNVRPKTCVSPGDCPTGAFCSRLTTCDPHATWAGQCWVVPSSCPRGGFEVAACDTGRCIDACEAIHEERAFQILTSSCSPFGSGMTPMMP